MKLPISIIADIQEGWLRAKLALTTSADVREIVRKQAKYGKIFDDMKTYCMFIGYPRSGHSLISSLIDAHPNAAIAHRLNAIKYVHAGYTQKELFHLSLRNSQRFAKTGRTLTGYQYQVPHQWQGDFQELQVIGDQEGKGTTQWLAQHPDLLPRLMTWQAVRVKFIHVIRNPYDNISTWAARLHRSLNYTIEQYFDLCKTNVWIRATVSRGNLLDIRHEVFLKNPNTGLKQLGNFLGIAVSDDYLSDCASIIFKSPHQSRRSAPWTPQLIQVVQDQINQFDFLEGYTFDSA